MSSTPQGVGPALYKFNGFLSYEKDCNRSFGSGDFGQNESRKELIK